MDSSEPKAAPHRHWVLPISTALALIFGTLMVIAVSAVLGIVLITSLANTRDLLIDAATASMRANTKTVENLLNPAEEQVRFLAGLIFNGTIDPDDREKLGYFLTAGLAGTPQIQALAFISKDLTIDVSDRRASGIAFHRDELHPHMRAGVEALKKTSVASWGPVTFIPEQKASFLNFRQPIHKDGAFIGALLAAIPTSKLQTALNPAGGPTGENRFILYGTQNVLAHGRPQKTKFKASLAAPLPGLDDIEDAVLKSIWREDRELLTLIENNDNFESHYLQINGGGYLFFYNSLHGYADKPLTLGFWLIDKDAMRELRRLALSAAAGLAVLLLSIIAAIILGRKIARPISALSAASRQISNLDFANAPTLPKSVFKELNEAASAYETMLRGLTWFENYVPKTLVRKLISSGEAVSEERLITIMFTDIAGFTSQAENMSAPEVANFLNAHFEILARCIEREEGTVDKFIGDAVMAFWGAPDDQEDHADRACRAANAIKAAIDKDNQLRRKTGLAPVQIRIGIHTGPIIVGNIGAKGRLNYTVVGDAVNIAQRLEQLGKQVNEAKEAGDISDTTILISGTTREALTGNFETVSAGEHNPRGRSQKIEIYELV